MDYLVVIAAESARISQLARIGPLDARVPHMKRWRLGDVVAHLGGVHRWAADIVTARRWDGEGHRRGQDEGDALIGWFDEGAERLVSTLAAAEPAGKCDNFSPGSPQTVGFWLRRQAHETTMHRWDAEAAVGSITPIDAGFASDGIDELFHTFTRTRGKQVLDAPLRITCTDTQATWTLVPVTKPGRVDLVPDQGTKPAGGIAGTAENLLLALWKRLPLEDSGLTLSGRHQLVADFIAGPVSP
ncbi:MAG: maleylpyruvate isomerase family mycothiol-dependent enzyme [Acidimicrobiia bacterium]